MHYRPFVFCLLILQNFSLFADYRQIIWGTHRGPDSPLHEPAVYGSPNPNWNTTGPSSVQKLMSADGSNLVSSSHDGTANQFSGDLIELGFFANNLGTSNQIGGTAGEADVPSTNLFHGTWVPLTTKTFIGQDWGNGSPANESVAAGEFAFKSLFQESTPGIWSDTVTHNAEAESSYDISGVDTQSILSDHLVALSTSTLIGIRFYDSNTKSEGVTHYNTVMNSNWTWPSANGDLEMWLHHESSPNDLDPSLRFEFDNTTYGSSGNYTPLVGGQFVSTNSAGNGTSQLGSDDLKTTLTYWSGASNLDISANNKDTILSGLTGSSNITGGSDNILTLNVNGAGTTSNSFTFTGDITDSGASGGLQLLKVGTGEQILTGAISLVSDNDSKVTIGEGTLTLKSSSNNQQFEYFTGSGTLKLDNTSNASHTVIIGLANTSAKQTLSGGVTLSGSGTNTINVGGGEVAGFGKHQEFSGVVTGAANLKKTGSGKLTLSGNNNFSGGVTIADGGGTKDGGILVAGHANALGTGTTLIEHGKLAIGAGKTVTTTIQGQETSNNTNMKSVIGGGVGNAVGTGIATIDNGGGTQIDIGSGVNEIDVISPGMAHASSMSNGTSDHQAVAGNHDASGSDDLTLSIGTIQIDKIGLKNGGVFDWEITDFAGNNADGSDWDVLKFDTLEFNEDSHTFDINIYSLASNGSAGGVSVDSSNHLYSSKTGTSGFKFMEWTGSGTPNGTTEGWLGDQTAREVTAFNINSDSWAYHNNFYYGDWSVWYESGSFYLQYSAVPEPSTYFMVTGLLMLPGYNFLRRIRKKKSSGDVGDLTDNA
jgi:autotransporter-associated beta strand protein